MAGYFVSLDANGNPTPILDANGNKIMISAAASSTKGMQMIKRTDQYGATTEVGYFDPTSGTAHYYAGYTASPNDTVETSS